MNMDARPPLKNFASSIFSAGTDFLLTWRIHRAISMITLFARARSAGPGTMFSRKIYCGDVNQLHARITPGNELTPEAYKWDSGLTHLARLHMYNLRRLALLLAQQMQFCRWPSWPVWDFVMNGISIWRKAGLDGHTALSASESVSKGNVESIAGVLLVFLQSIVLLNALLASIGIPSLLIFFTFI